MAGAATLQLLVSSVQSIPLLVYTESKLLRLQMLDSVLGSAKINTYMNFREAKMHTASQESTI